MISHSPESDYQVSDKQYVLKTETLRSVPLVTSTRRHCFHEPQDHNVNRQSLQNLKPYIEIDMQ